MSQERQESSTKQSDCLRTQMWMFLQLILFSSPSKLRSKRIPNIVHSQQREGWWWQRRSLKITSTSLKLIPWEENRLIFPLMSLFTFMEVRNSITMRSKWQISDRRWTQRKFILMERNVSIWILTQKLLTNKKRGKWLWVFPKCIRKINFLMCWSKQKKSGWNLQKDQEIKIFLIWSTTHIMSRKVSPSRNSKTQEISQLTQDKLSSKSISGPNKYLVLFLLFKDKNYLQFNKKGKTDKKGS